MNVRRHLFAVALVILVAFANIASALPPRTHSIRGEIIAIDPANESFVVRDARSREETTIRWKAHSRFITSDGRAGPCCLGTGVVAKVSFRREVGEKVAREVRWPTAVCK
jgi:hypothetical protein